MQYDFFCAIKLIFHSAKWDIILIIYMDMSESLEYMEGMNWEGDRENRRTVDKELPS